MQGKVRSILITGSPGVGKTTLVKKICAKMKEQGDVFKYHGFYTEEVRENQGRGRRLGFDIISLSADGLRAALAREASGSSKGPTVGKYCVRLNDFEAIALSTLESSNSQELLVVDEIGKMELKSKAFTTAIQRLIYEKPLLATVPLKTFGASLAFVDELKKSPSSIVYLVTTENRNDLEEKILKDIKQLIGK